MDAHALLFFFSRNLLKILFQFKTDCLSICIIDDCKDADVPLLELSMINLTFKHDMIKGNGSAHCQFASDYYNRILSGWEPFLEPWR